MTVEEAEQEILAWLDRTGQRGAVSGNGRLPLAVAARWLGAQPGTLRLQNTEGRQGALKFKRRGRLWDVELRSLAEHHAQQDEQDERELVGPGASTHLHGTAKSPL
jgi:hypothetical protein